MLKNINLLKLHNIEKKRYIFLDTFFSEDSHLVILKLIVLKHSPWKVESKKLCIAPVAFINLLNDAMQRRKFSIGLTYKWPSVWYYICGCIKTRTHCVWIYIMLLHFWHRISGCRNKSIANLIIFCLSSTSSYTIRVSFKFKCMVSPIFIILFEYRQVSIRVILDLYITMKYFISYTECDVYFWQFNTYVISCNCYACYTNINGSRVYFFFWIFEN